MRPVGVGTESGGHVLRVEEGEVDARRFEQLAAAGARRPAEGRHPAAKFRLVEPRLTACGHGAAAWGSSRLS